GGLRRREPADEHADDREEEEDRDLEDAAERPDPLPPAELLTGRAVLGTPDGDDESRGHQEDADEDPGEQGGAEERGDRLLGLPRDDDEGGRRRDEDAERAADGDRTGGEPLVV